MKNPGDLKIPHVHLLKILYTRFFKVNSFGPISDLLKKLVDFFLVVYKLIFLMEDHLQVFHYDWPFNLLEAG